MKWDLWGDTLLFVLVPFFCFDLFCFIHCMHEYELVGLLEEYYHPFENYWDKERGDIYVWYGSLCFLGGYHIYVEVVHQYTFGINLLD